MKNLPKVHIGKVKKESERKDWRKEKQEIDPDDTEVETSDDVIKILGFDPKRNSHQREKNRRSKS